eukprot:960107_1
MDQENKFTISFEAVWMDIKSQHQNDTTKPSADRPSYIQLVSSNSWSQNDPNNIFHYAKRNLSPSKHLQNRSPFAVKTGRVLEADDMDDELETKSDMSEVSSFTFNFMDYNMDVDEDDEDTSVCSSIAFASSPTMSQSKCSLQLIASNSLPVTVSDSVAVVTGHVLDVVNEIDASACICDHGYKEKRNSYSQTFDMDSKAGLFSNKKK